MRQSFAKALGAFAIVATACVLAGLAYDLAVWIAWQPAPHYFDFLRWTIPADKYLVFLSRETYVPRCLPITADVLYLDTAMLTFVAFITQGLALLFSAIWIRYTWPRYWLNFDVARRRGLLWSVWWQSSLCLVITLPLVEWIWVIFFRVHLANEGRLSITVDMSLRSLLLNWFAIPVIQTLVIAHILTRGIRLSVSAVERRCIRCGYCLTAPTAMICPECGILEPWPFVAQLGWLRVFTAPFWNKWVVLLWIVPILMLMAPVIFPFLQVIHYEIGKFLHG